VICGKCRHPASHAGYLKYFHRLSAVLERAMVRTGFFDLAAVLLAMCGIVFGSNASAGSQVVPTDQEVVAQRALERWNLMIEGRIESAYDYLSPGYRAAHSLASYSRSIRGGIWKAADIHEIACSTQRCEVKVILDLVVDASGRPVPVPVDEIWIQTEPGGDWWYVPL